MRKRRNINLSLFVRIFFKLYYQIQPFIATALQDYVKMEERVLILLRVQQTTLVSDAAVLLATLANFVKQVSF